jgi:hypothetical protein
MSRSVFEDNPAPADGLEVEDADDSFHDVLGENQWD